ncbi:unnamed protein product [Pseudo-nitzschia multistriata]|uniref:Macro domain-containing protein n=1 Tax=Pseudo-nitzschia multistriata TaxID=183589 RepID=A0A448ZH27_9STRA|nr:unnamed protein product [Pseudo-nitzschia multistriata]
MGLKTIATYGLGKGKAGSRRVSLRIARGSVLDFSANETAPSAGNRTGAIVNAANEGCLDGGGVDGAINKAGGPALWKDRKALPVVARGNVRCPTGHAVVTGPNSYGALHVPYVVHAVGPPYAHFDEDRFPELDAALRSAYRQSLDRCREEGVTDVAFSLLSAGIFRGSRGLPDVLAIAAEAIRDWVDDADGFTTDAANAAAGSSPDGQDESEVPSRSRPHCLESVTLCGFSEKELLALTTVCQALFAKGDDDQDGEEDEEDDPDRKVEEDN